MIDAPDWFCAMVTVMRFQRRLIGVAILLAISAVFVLWSRSIPSADLLERAKRALARMEFEDAERLARQVPTGSPESAQALLVAGEASTRLGRHEASLDYYSRIPDDCKQELLTGLPAAVAISMETGQLSLAERHLRRILECAPGNLFATQRLARLLRIEGRRWDSKPLFFELLRQGQCDVEELVLLGDVDLTVDVPSVFLSTSPQKPDDPMTVLWRATQARLDNQESRAEVLLRQVIADVPDQVEAHAQLGQVLLERDDADSLLQWQAELPQTADDHPEIWFLRGRWLEVRQAPEFAIRCFAEALWRNPDHIAANYRMSQLLISLERHETAQPFIDRANTLQQLEAVLFTLDENHTDIARMQHAAQLTESLGRIWEAWGWCQVAIRRNPQLSWARQSSLRLRRLVEQNPPRVLVSANPTLTTDWSPYPLPDWETLPGVPVVAKSAVVPVSHAVFENMALSAGLDFKYFNSGAVDSGTMNMYEFTGGGVAVLDYDADGWPDVYLTQGCRWPPGSGGQVYRDRLYHNLGNGMFQDVTMEALAGDEGFSQGATIGDYNNDGFPDLYVGNIGENRFCQNNGDGTVTTITEQTRTGGDAWTTSCLLADLNGDTWPDLYVVNYLKGDDIFERVCRTRDKGPLSGICPPATFAAEQDRCYLNLGDGRFQDVTHSTGIEVSNGKGLGVVAFASETANSAGLNLFVANDAVPNFYFVNQTAPRGGSLKFAELAMLCGLALDQNGRAQACMGIAAGDVDNDGLLDFLVTNFFHESSTLYVQQPGGNFMDATRQRGLHKPSHSSLGFGTQFLDGDLDGHLDLVVANGHVDNYAHAGIPYQMRPQYFHNLGDGRFEETTSAVLGPWFSSPCLGRSVARLDWNRDGREDFIVSSLDTAAALLSNQTPVVGHYLAIQVRGVRSDRDAIGTSIRLIADGVTQVRQLTAGDGYLASNQRQLIFGLGDADHVDSLSVKWTSGLEQTFRDFAANQELLIIEGRSTPIRLPGPSK